MPPPSVHECFSEFEHRWSDIEHPDWSAHLTDEHELILGEIYHGLDDAQNLLPSDFIPLLCEQDPILNEMFTTFNDNYNTFVEADIEADQQLLNDAHEQVPQ